jgi:hypothetical protein
MIAWQSELGRSFARAAARRGRPVGGRGPFAEAERAGLEYDILAKGRDPERKPAWSEPSANVFPIARGLRGPGGLRSVLREIARTRDLGLYADALAIVERAHRDLRALLARR